MNVPINESDPDWVKKIKKKPKLVKFILICCWVFLILSMFGAVYFVYDLWYKLAHIDEFVKQEFYAICMDTKEKVFFNQTHPEYVCGELNPFLREENMSQSMINDYFDQNNFTYQKYDGIEK